MDARASGATNTASRKRRLSHFPLLLRSELHLYSFRYGATATHQLDGRFGEGVACRLMPALSGCGRKLAHSSNGWATQIGSERAEGPQRTMRRVSFCAVSVRDRRVSGRWRENPPSKQLVPRGIPNLRRQQTSSVVRPRDVLSVGLTIRTLSKFLGQPPEPALVFALEDPR